MERVRKVIFLFVLSSIWSASVYGLEIGNNRVKFIISEKKVLEALNNPDLIDYSRLPLLIAQCKIDMTHVLRVVYKEEQGIMKVITFYPGRSKNYDKK